MLHMSTYVVFALILVTTMTSCSLISLPAKEMLSQEEIFPPAVPAEVLSVWKTPPSPHGYPPDIADEFHLGKYGSPNDSFEADSFFLQDCQWIDIIVKSKNLSVKFYDREPGIVYFGVDFRYLGSCGRSGFSPDLEAVGGEYLGQIANPCIGKILYGHPMCKETMTGKSTIYSVAIRLFVEGGDCHDNPLDSICSISFTNYNVDEEVDITYEVYKLDITPEWGIGGYYSNTLLPWLQQTKSEAEREQMWNKWIEQFK